MARRLNNLEKTLTIPSKYHATLERCKQIENNSSLQENVTEKQAKRLSPKRRGFPDSYCCQGGQNGPRSSQYLSPNCEKVYVYGYVYGYVAKVSFEPFS